MRTNRTAAQAIQDEEIREKVGKGTASTIYQVPISRPAQVVDRQADPETVRAYSDVHEAQIAKVTSGLAMYLLTVAALGGLVWALVEWLDFHPSRLVIIAVHVAVVVAAIPIALPGGRPGWTAGALAVIVATIASGALTDGELFACLVAVLATAMLNPRGTPAIISGLKALGIMPSLDEILWTHHEKMEVYDDHSSEQPAPAGIPVMNLPGDKPVFGSSPYPLLAQIEDFCFAAMSERYNEKGKVMSGLSRDYLLGKVVGPPNGSIADRPQSAMKVTRGTYDTIIDGLVEVGLVQKIDGVGTVWAKIAPSTTYTCGWNIEEIRRVLRRYASTY